MMVQVQIVTYNSADVILDCLEAVARQVDISNVLVIDNASSDKTLELVAAAWAGIALLQNSTNIGYAAAHNQGFRMAQEKGAEIVLTLNPDTVLSDGYIQQCLLEFKSDDSIGGVSGKIVRLDNPAYLDTTGIVINGFFHGKDRGSGEVDGGQYDNSSRVLGICGAAAFYRVTMLADIALPNGEVFDETFVTYKEDIDLSLRAILKGWVFHYDPNAKALHKRGWKPRQRMDRRISVQSQLNQLSLLLTYYPWGMWFLALLVGELLRLVKLNWGLQQGLWTSVRKVAQIWMYAHNKRKILAGGRQVKQLLRDLTV